MEAAELLLHLRAHGEVERGQRLVEQKDVGLGSERAGESDSLSLSTGDLCRHPVGEVGQADQLEHRERPPPALGPGHAADLQPEGDVLEHGQVWKQRVALECEAEPALLRRRARDPAPVEIDVPGRRRLEPCDDAQQRRLAAARRAEQRHELTVLDLERDPVESGDVPEPLGHVGEPDRAHETPTTPPPPG